MTSSEDKSTQTDVFFVNLPELTASHLLNNFQNGLNKKLKEKDNIIEKEKGKFYNQNI